MRLEPFAIDLALAVLLSACAPAPAPKQAPFSLPSATAESPSEPGSTEAPAATQPPVEPTSTPPPTPQAASIPDPDSYRWQLLADGLDRPLDLTHAGDGSGRLFVVGKAGLITILQSETVLPGPFLDIRGRIDSGAYERGLLGLAFHPRYAENGYFYVNYTDLNGDTVIARFQVSGDDPDRADPGSEVRLLQVAQPYANHNGGGLAFGPDGYLYLGLGDGGSGGDPLGNGQSLDTLLGKLLRIDVDGGALYAIPPDNPLAEGGGRPEVWAYGLRNPWRFSFDPDTGDLYIGDVGQNLWEEIDFLPAGHPGGANFGWNYYEGNHVYAGEPPADLELVPPVAEYGQGASHCSVTGGVVYRGQALPAWQGVYLYGDFCSGAVWGLVRQADGGWQGEQVFQLSASIASFGYDEAGEVYLVSLDGQVYRLEAR